MAQEAEASQAFASDMPVNSSSLGLISLSQDAMSPLALHFTKQKSGSRESGGIRETCRSDQVLQNSQKSGYILLPE
ncbi:hypothetical protein PGTUg99_031043 [Puccinia graminis f. sp. tritici]|uniref:Uncharacterized protein n=1 Tax=Puccinia graminis f. sp. tritici TaxID=56615 RepID=A0A5B0SKX4_PUCGR|nr:hypothetical protein PGTUg99_031043 [Puccinia graminis f. sp. tritici]